MQEGVLNQAKNFLSEKPQQTEGLGCTLHPSATPADATYTLSNPHFPALFCSAGEGGIIPKGSDVVPRLKLDKDTGDDLPAAEVPLFCMQGLDSMQHTRVIRDRKTALFIQDFTVPVFPIALLGQVGPHSIKW